MSVIGEQAVYRPGLPDRPPRMAKLILDSRGFPVPWFVALIDGVPDFRVIRENGIAYAHNYGICWLCGEPLGRYGAFVIGPMCGINRVNSEPPSHRDCAEYAVRACPFMTKPRMVRNERGLDESVKPAGVGLRRNPGVVLLWVTKSWKPFRVDNGVLFRLGEPTDIAFYACGRKATREEIDASIASGLPLLEEPAHAEGPDAVKALARMKADFDQRLPARECAS